MLRSVVKDGRKFMWDGRIYEDQATMKERVDKYEKDGFETTSITENGKHMVFTRRVVTEIVLEGGGP